MVIREVCSHSNDYSLSIDAGQVSGDTYSKMITENKTQKSFWGPPKDHTTWHEG